MHHQAPLSKADSPYQGEMSRRDKRDRASRHGAAVTEGFRTPANPPHPSWLRHATFSPAGAPSPLEGEGSGRGDGIPQSRAAQPLAALLPYGCGVPLAGAALLGMTE